MLISTLPLTVVEPRTPERTLQRKRLIAEVQRLTGRARLDDSLKLQPERELAIEVLRILKASTDDGGSASAEQVMSNGPRYTESPRTQNGETPDLDRHRAGHHERAAGTLGRRDRRHRPLDLAATHDRAVPDLLAGALTRTRRRGGRERYSAEAVNRKEPRTWLVPALPVVIRAPARRASLALPVVSPRRPTRWSA